MRTRSEKAAIKRQHGAGHVWATLSKLATQVKVQGGAIHEARVAAICLDHAISEP